MIDYANYVDCLCNRFPQLRSLKDFLRTPTPRHCVPDKVTVVDILQDGSLSREEISTVLLQDSGENLADKLQNNPPELKTRLICVSHLTPHTASILGARHDLSADFLNGHLPHSEIQQCQVGLHNDLSFHSHFEESYVHDGPFLESIRSAPTLDILSTRKIHVLIMLGRAVRRFFHRFEYNIRDVFRGTFFVEQTISVHVQREDDHLIALVLFSPRIPVDRVAYQFDEPKESSPREWILQFKPVAEPVPLPSECIPSAPSEIKSHHLADKIYKNIQEHWTAASCLDDDLALWLRPVFQWIYSQWWATISQLDQELEKSESTNEPEEAPKLVFLSTSQRKLISRCQTYISSDLAVLERLRRSETSSQTKASSSHASYSCPQSIFTNTVRVEPWSSMIEEFDALRCQMEKLQERCDRVVQTHLALVQIHESRLAIAQSEIIRRLTVLAFIFIPLTYVAAVFSADLREMDGHRTAKAFSCSSIATAMVIILSMLFLEDYIWPTITWPFRKWNDLVWSFFPDAKDYKGKREGWFLLPIRTLLVVSHLVKMMRTRPNVSESEMTDPRV